MGTEGGRTGGGREVVVVVVMVGGGGGRVWREHCTSSDNKTCFSGNLARLKEEEGEGGGGGWEGARR